MNVCASTNSRTSPTGCHVTPPTYRSPKLREKAIQVLRDLLASHDSDLRYNNGEARAKIASIYLPLLSILMDNYHILYKGADGWEDWTTTFERNTSVRRSVVIRGDSIDGSLEIEQVTLYFFYSLSHVHVQENHNMLTSKKKRSIYPFSRSIQVKMWRTYLVLLALETFSFASCGW